MATIKGHFDSSRGVSNRLSPSFRHSPPEESAKARIAPLRVSDYFTIDRFRDAGIDPTRLRMSLLTVFDRAGIIFMGDLLELGRLGLMRKPGAGKKMCEAIERILQKDGIKRFG